MSLKKLSNKPENNKILSRNPFIELCHKTKMRFNNSLTYRNYKNNTLKTYSKATFNRKLNSIDRL